MGTRSRIGVMHGDKIKSVYCHWDGYLEHNGAILQEHYDSTKANNLVALGDLSSLRANIGVQHAFSKLDIPEDQAAAFEVEHGESCTFYGRDRGEENTSWQVAHTFEEFLKQVDNCCAEYYYIMKDGIWYAGAVYDVMGLIKNGLVELSQALKTVNVEVTV
jgi:hypothetical protein